MRLVLAMMLLLAGSAIPASAHGQSPPHHLLPNGRALAFRFGTGGAIMLAGTVEIHVNGAVDMVGGVPCLQPHARVTQAQLLRILHLADTDGFFSLPPRIRSSQRNVDLAWLSVSIYTTSGTKTVQEAPGAANGSFDRVYHALKHIAPFTFACSVSVTGPLPRSTRLVHVHAGSGPPDPGSYMQRTNPPHYRPMPCPHGVQPDAVAVSWRFQVLSQHPTSGHRLIRSAGVVRDFYRSICSTTLTWFAHPVVTSCPAARSDDVYHIAFLRKGLPVLRIEDQVEGCTFFWVEGKHRLGWAWGTPLPAGIPNPPLG
jgi:hypothetical protein